jgi:hypothetical protein
VDLFGRLVYSVLDFLKFYFADYVEAIVGCHVFVLIRNSIDLYYVRPWWERGGGSLPW